MKKSITAILCFLPALWLFAGCAAAEEAFEEKTYTAEAGQISAVNLDVNDRKIELEPSEDGGVQIGYQESAKEFYDIEVQDGTLTMVSREDKEWGDFIGGNAPLKARTIRLQLPAGALTSLSLATSNEDLSLPPLSFSGSVSITVNNGSISFEELSVGSTLSLETKNGDISGTIAGSYEDFEIASILKKGKSNLPESKAGGSKKLTASVNNGDIDIQFKPQ